MNARWEDMKWEWDKGPNSTPFYSHVSDYKYYVDTIKYYTRFAKWGVDITPQKIVELINQWYECNNMKKLERLQ